MALGQAGVTNGLYHQSPNSDGDIERIDLGAVDMRRMPFIRWQNSGIL